MPINNKDVAEQLSKLHELHQSGALTDDEFNKAKHRLLGDTQQSTPYTSVLSDEEENASNTPASPVRRGVLVICGLIVALFVIGSIFDYPGSDDSSPTPTPASVQAQDEGDELEPLITGIVVLMGVANTETPGESCHGVGDHSMFSEGATASVTAIGGRHDFEGMLSAGTVDQYGHCRMTFGAPAFNADKYQFGFDNDFFVHCDSDSLVGLDGGHLTTQVRVAPNGAYCQAPAN